MNMNDLNHAMKADLVSSAVILLCIGSVIVAAELSAPIVAGFGAFGAAATAIYRVVTTPRKQ